MENINHQVIIGLPKSGKSTFVGALWQVVDVGDIESSFTAIVQPSHREYLNRLREAWYNCEAPGRTITGTANQIELILKNNETGEIGTIMFPDVDGEMYKEQFETRQMLDSYLQLLKRATGILLFIDPNKRNTPVAIAEAVLLLEEEEIKNQDETISWEYKHCPIQVQLVDLLQIVAGIVNTPVKLSIIISAWDMISNVMVPQATKSPEVWLEQELPLLHQFLITNLDVFESAIFGISAQGGEYTAKAEELQALENQSERIVVDWKGDRSHDITLPIKWLING